MLDSVLLALGAGLAVALELLEAAAIVLAVGLSRRWSDALIGAAAAVAMCAVVAIVAGPLLLEKLPDAPLEIAIGVPGPGLLRRHARARYPAPGPRPSTEAGTGGWNVKAMRTLVLGETWALPLGVGGLAVLSVAADHAGPAGGPKRPAHCWLVLATTALVLVTVWCTPRS